MSMHPRPPHIPDVMTSEGFWSFVNTGNIIKLAVALDHRSYAAMPIEDQEEQELCHPDDIQAGLPGTDIAMEVAHIKAWHQ